MKHRNIIMIINNETKEILELFYTRRIRAINRRENVPNMISMAKVHKKVYRHYRIMMCNTMAMPQAPNELTQAASPRYDTGRAL